MSFSPPRARLRLERLETRYCPSDLGTTPPAAPPEPPPSGLIDPTLNPVDNSNSTVAVFLVSMSGPDAVNVSGVSASQLQGVSSIRLVIGNDTFSVTAYSANQDGTIRLAVTGTSGASLSDAMSNNLTGTLILGNGGNTTPPATPPPPPPSGGGLIDPTLNPQGGG